MLISFLCCRFSGDYLSVAAWGFLLAISHSRRVRQTKMPGFQPPKHRYLTSMPIRVFMVFQTRGTSNEQENGEMHPYYGLLVDFSSPTRKCSMNCIPRPFR
jgi:hypothetical protein